MKKYLVLGLILSVMNSWGSQGQDNIMNLVVNMENKAANSSIGVEAANKVFGSRIIKQSEVKGQPMTVNRFLIRIADATSDAKIRSFDLWTSAKARDVYPG